MVPKLSAPSMGGSTLESLWYHWGSSRATAAATTVTPATKYTTPRR